ncbi:MAG: leucine-rich repeat domain-containing protein, partial [Bacteroidaceae bacterium]|nr:leucine-rich repeat domain-containing protein [Bacteroidaceae bacterium]
KFEQLQKLECGGNKITDINVLAKVKFPKLKKLVLNMNSTPNS